MIYIEFDVTPIFQEGIPSDLRDAFACCFVDRQNADEAERIAIYKIEQSGWKVLRNRCMPIKVSLENFKNKDVGTENFLSASKRGIAIVFVGVSEEQGSKNPNPELLPFSSEINLAEYFAMRKEIREKGCCLYYQTKDCDEMIEAHSIQRSGVLSLIAQDNEVLVPSINYSDLKKNKGRITFRSRPITQVSTFRGFCKRHDNQIFQPIDDQFLLPTGEQAMLYAYRSLGREISAKRDALENYETQIKKDHLTNATRKLIADLEAGTRLGLENLMRQKEFFEATHRARTFDDIRYVAFCAKTKPSVVFSGCLFPETGFYHEKIQNLMADNLDLLLFSFAPMKAGWAMLFSWHKESDRSNEAFLGSLANFHRKLEQLEDLLFGMVLSGCENLAIAPQWIAKMNSDQIIKLEEAFSSGSSVFSKYEMRDVIDNLKGLTDWKFDSVIDSRR